MKKIYLNADRGSWIKARMKQMRGLTYVLDGFHLEKYLSKLVSHRKKEPQRKTREEIREIIQNKTKIEFREFVEKQKKKMPTWGKREKVDEASEYIQSNWTAARLGLKDKEEILGSSTESHVSHSLSSRMIS